MVTSTKKSQTSLYNPLILILNDIFDAFGLAEMDQQLQVQFFRTLNELDKLVKANVTLLGMETISNAVYYFCKFQAGSDDFWQLIEN